MGVIFFRQTGLNAILRFELRDILTPRVLLSEPYRSREGGEQFKPERIRESCRMGDSAIRELYKI